MHTFLLNATTVNNSLYVILLKMSPLKSTYFHLLFSALS